MGRRCHGIQRVQSPAARAWGAQGYRGVCRGAPHTWQAHRSPSPSWLVCVSTTGFSPELGTNSRASEFSKQTPGWGPQAGE